MASTEALQLASEVSSLLKERGTRCLIIGAIALAAHGYVRGTEDVDLGIAVDPSTLHTIARLILAGVSDVSVDVELPSPEDPLGGVINIRRGEHPLESLVQVVNFDNAPGAGFPALINQATSETFFFPNGTRGDLVSAEDLVFFKLYAGGTKSRADIEELLSRRKLDLTKLHELARRYRMTYELEVILGG